MRPDTRIRNERPRSESLPQYILRHGPKSDAELRRLLTGTTVGWREAWELKREIDRLSERGAELIRRHARPAAIERCAAELRLLRAAAEALEV